ESLRQTARDLQLLEKAAGELGHRLRALEGLAARAHRHDDLGRARGVDQVLRKRARRMRPTEFLCLALGALAACGPAPRNFDETRAFEHLLTQVRFGPRIPGSEGHRKQYEWMRDHLQMTAERVSEHTFAAVSPLDSTNVEFRSLVAVFNEKSPRRILFGAHWDTRAVADEETDPELRKQPVPGANDGGSGVAILLEIASQLKERPPEIGVDLAFFDGEDQGLHGDPRSWA